MTGLHYKPSASMFRRLCVAILIAVAISSTAVASAGSRTRYCGTWGANPFRVYATRSVSCDRAKRVTRDSFFRGCTRSGSCRVDGYWCRSRLMSSGDYRTACTHRHRKVVWYGGP